MTTNSPDLGTLNDCIDEIGEMVDTCANMLAAAVLPVPPEIHIEALQGGYRDMQEKLRTIYVKQARDNPEMRGMLVGFARNANHQMLRFMLRLPKVIR